MYCKLPVSHYLLHWWERIIPWEQDTDFKRFARLLKYFTQCFFLSPLVFRWYQFPSWKWTMECLSNLKVWWTWSKHDNLATSRSPRTHKEGCFTVTPSTGDQSQQHITTSLKSPVCTMITWLETGWHGNVNVSFSSAYDAEDCMEAAFPSPPAVKFGTS